MNRLGFLFTREVMAAGSAGNGGVSARSKQRRHIQNPV